MREGVEVVAGDEIRKLSDQFHSDRREGSPPGPDLDLPACDLHSLTNYSREQIDSLPKTEDQSVCSLCCC
jgi:hypothetical protein